MFKDKLKNSMEEQGILQFELASAVGKSPAAISNYLTGKSLPRQKVLEKIARVLNCDAEWLISKDDEDDILLEKITVNDVAKAMKKNPQFVRQAIITKQVDFGIAVKSKSKWNFYINPKKFAEYMGV